MKVSIGYENAVQAAGGSVEQAARILRETGFSGVDYPFCSFESLKSILTGEASQRILDRAKILTENGIEISQSHLHYLPGSEIYGDGTYECFESAYLPAYIRSIELCGEIGCPVTVIHLYFENDPQKTFESNIKLISKLLPHLEKHNVILAIENIFAGGEKYLPCHITTSNNIMRYIQAFNSPYIAACLDTGHAHITGQDPIEMINTYGKNLKALHINSNTGRDMHVMPGMFAKWLDGTDFEAISTALKNTGYNGSYNLEINFGNWPADIKAQAGEAYLKLVYITSSYYANLID